MAEEKSGREVHEVVSARNGVMKEMAEERAKQLKEESAETLPAVEDSTPPVVETPEDKEAAAEQEDKDSDLEKAGAAASAAADAEPEPKPAAAAPDAAPAPVAFDPTAEYELEVEGKKIKVAGSKILERGRQAIQKETAADYKLQLASQLLEEAKARTELSRKADAQPPAPVAPRKPAPEPIDDGKLAEMIQFGTKEQAAEALKTLRESHKATSPEQVMAFVAKSIGPMVNARLEFERAVEMVNKEYPDLMKNDYLRRLFASEETRRRAPKARGGEGDIRPSSELYRVIGDDLRKAFNMPKPELTPAPAKETPTLEQKREAKAAAPAVPKPASARIESKGEPRPLTPTEAINKIRAARHQPPI